MHPTRAELVERFGIAGSRSSNAAVLYHQAAAEQFGLNATDMKTLPLFAQKGRMSAGELSQSLGLTTGAITSVIDRLERAGFVRRVSDPNDRRKVVVELNPERIESAYQVYAPLAVAVGELAEKYSDKELELLIGFMEVSTEIMLREGAKLRRKDKLE